MQDKKTAAITLEGNPTTGYTWVYDLSAQIIREVSNEYVADNANRGLPGAGGKFIFIFEAVTAGEAELVFSYLRVWEENVPAIYTVTYRVLVDDNNSITLTRR